MHLSTYPGIKPMTNDQFEPLENVYMVTRHSKILIKIVNILNSGHDGPRGIKCSFLEGASSRVKDSGEWLQLLKLNITFHIHVETENDPSCVQPQF